jgi:hypothetical protein
LAVNISTHMELLEWNEGESEKIFSMPSVYRQVKFIEYNNSVYIADGNALLGSDYTHDSKVYKWIK